MCILYMKRRSANQNEVKYQQYFFVNGTRLFFKYFFIRRNFFLKIVRQNRKLLELSKEKRRYKKKNGVLRIAL